jgi:hypothetical protein
MSQKNTKHTGTFRAKATDGREYTIDEFTEYLSGHSSSGAYNIEGLKFYKCDDGRYVNKIEKGKYEIVDIPNIPITSDDPRA